MRRKRSDTHEAARQPRPSQRIPAPAPGTQPGKLPEIAHCPGCQASYRDGRWTWKPAPVGSYERQCPACKRVEDDYPAGVLHVEGGFAASHRDELIGLIRNVEERERSEHPLKRVMGIVDEDAGFAVTTTDAKLVEAFGKALQRAYDGRFEHGPTTSDRENLVRGRWVRE